MAATDAVKEKAKDVTDHKKSKAQDAIEFAKQSAKLGQYTSDQENDETGSTQAIEAKFITAQDPVIETANGERLPAVPLEEAQKLNELKNTLDENGPTQIPKNEGTREAKDGTVHGMGM